MAQTIRLLNRPAVTLEEPKSGLDIFFEEIAKYASPEYQLRKQEIDNRKEQLALDNQRADARLTLAERDQRLSEEKFRENVDFSREQRRLEKERDERDYKLKLNVNKKAMWRQGKQDLDSLIGNIPLKDFTKGEDYVSGVIKSSIDIPKEEENLFNLGSRLEAYGVAKARSKINEAQDIYNIAEKYQTFLPNYDADMIAKSIQNNDFSSITKELFSGQSISDKDKDKLKNYSTQLTTALKDKSLAYESHLSNPEDENLKQAYIDASNAVSDIDDNINSIYLNYRNPLSQLELTTPNENDDLKGINFDVQQTSPGGEYYDELTGEIKFSPGGIYYNEATEDEYDDTVFASSEELQEKIMNDALLNAQGGDTPLFGSDAPRAGEVPSDIPPAWLSPAGIDDDAPAKLDMQGKSLENTYPTSTFASRARDEFIKDYAEARRKASPKSADAEMLPDVEPDDISGLLKEFDEAPKFDEKSTRNVLDTWEQKEIKFEKGKPRPSIMYTPALKKVSKLLKSIGVTKNKYGTIPESKQERKRITLKGLAEQQSELRDILVPYISPETGSFLDSSFDSKFYRNLSRMTGMDVPMLKDLILSNVSYNI